MIKSILFGLANTKLSSKNQDKSTLPDKIFSKSYTPSSSLQLNESNKDNSKNNLETISLNQNQKVPSSLSLSINESNIYQTKLKSNLHSDPNTIIYTNLDKSQTKINQFSSKTDSIYSKTYSSPNLILPTSLTYSQTDQIRSKFNKFSKYYSESIILSSILPLPTNLPKIESEIVHSDLQHSKSKINQSIFPTSLPINESNFYLSQTKTVSFSNHNSQSIDLNSSLIIPTNLPKNEKFDQSKSALFYSKSKKIENIIFSSSVLSESKINSFSTYTSKSINLDFNLVPTPNFSKNKAHLENSISRNFKTSTISSKLNYISHDYYKSTKIEQIYSKTRSYLIPTSILDINVTKFKTESHPNTQLSSSTQIVNKDHLSQITSTKISLSKPILYSTTSTIYIRPTYLPHHKSYTQNNNSSKDELIYSKTESTKYFSIGSKKTIPTSLYISKTNQLNYSSIHSDNSKTRLILSPSLINSKSSSFSRLETHESNKPVSLISLTLSSNIIAPTPTIKSQANSKITINYTPVLPPFIPSSLLKDLNQTSKPVATAVPKSNNITNTITTKKDIPQIILCNDQFNSTNTLIFNSIHYDDLVFNPNLAALISILLPQELSQVLNIPAKAIVVTNIQNNNLGIKININLNEVEIKKLYQLINSNKIEGGYLLNGLGFNNPVRDTLNPLYSFVSGEYKLVNDQPWSLLIFGVVAGLIYVIIIGMMVYKNRNVK